jgi:hypothetical protein
MCSYVTCVPHCRSSVRNHDNPAHRSRNPTLYKYDIPPIRSVFHVTQTDSRNSLMMADYCRNMSEQVYRIKMWYKAVHSVGLFILRLVMHGTNIKLINTCYHFIILCNIQCDSACLLYSLCMLSVFSCNRNWVQW